MLAELGRWLFRQPYILLSLTSLFWAGNIVLGRFIAGRVPPVALAQIRWSAAGLVLLPFAWRGLKADWPAIRASLPVVLILSATGIGAYNTMAYYGLQYTEALNALLMQSSGPLLIGVWSLALFGDRLSRAQVLGILTSLVGVVVIVARGDPGAIAGLRLNSGDLWMLAAMVLYGLYSAMLRRRPTAAPLSLLAATILIGQAMIWPFTVAEFLSGARMTPSGEALAVIAYVAIVPSILAYLFFNRGVELIGANRAGPFFHLMPVFGSALAIVFLGEHAAPFHFIGYGLIVAGIVVAQRGSGARAAAGTRV
ncbi:MAG: DMT family transporter [Bauldia sp.]